MNVQHRKRYSNNGTNNNYRRPNRSGGGSGSGGGGGHRSNGSSNNSQGNNFGPPRPRKNFRALQEKYLNMAKEAMGSGDRILAEYYLQHADHYHRENEAFLEERNQWHESRAQKRSDNPQPTDSAEAAADAATHFNDEDAGDDADGADVEDEVDLSSSGSALPAFLTRKVTPKENEKVVQIQNWED